MNQESRQLPEMKRADLTELRKLIDASFMHDWAIRVELCRQSEDQEGWVEWGNTRFAIKDVLPVIDELQACCDSNPDCCIRMVCEHFNPQYKFVYCLQKEIKAGSRIDDLGVEVYHPKK
jgi:ribulose bisphosphate carboxylase small subunit